MTVPNPPPIDLTNIQGDIILGFPKRVEDFIFFTINGDVSSFRRVVGSKEFLQLITPAFYVQNFRTKIKEHKAQFARGQAPLIQMAAVNIGFTKDGLGLFNLPGSLGDGPFEQGQFANAKDLGDNGEMNGDRFDPDWFAAFKGVIHGVILVAGDSRTSIDAVKATLFELLGNSITEVHTVSGKARPHPYKGREHFGYMDGVSEPAVEGIVSPLPGQPVVRPGILLMGRDGDTVSRPDWALDGSIMVYRHLEQKVPEFDEFKRQHALPADTEEEGAELLGARLVGRWKSGAPIPVAHLKDDQVLADDYLKNNDFIFNRPSQVECPFAAHVRKTNPRNDIGFNISGNLIKRAGIPFGPEVGGAERSQKKTLQERGLSFVCYQSNLSNGFEFMQKSWANDTTFPIGKDIEPGFDPLIGQDNGRERFMTGYNPNAPTERLTFRPEDQFVFSKGGAYFFTPSITTLGSRIGILAGAPIKPA